MPVSSKTRHGWSCSGVWSGWSSHLAPICTQDLWSSGTGTIGSLFLSHKRSCFPRFQFCLSPAPSEWWGHIVLFLELSVAHCLFEILPLSLESVFPPQVSVLRPYADRCVQPIKFIAGGLQPGCKQRHGSPSELQIKCQSKGTEYSLITDYRVTYYRRCTSPRSTSSAAAFWLSLSSLLPLSWEAGWTFALTSLMT